MKAHSKVFLIVWIEFTVDRNFIERCIVVSYHLTDFFRGQLQKQINFEDLLLSALKKLVFFI